MSRDGRYSARSQGRRCGYVQGWTVFRKEPGKGMHIISEDSMLVRSQA
jgi:hypothetical protein